MKLLTSAKNLLSTFHRLMNDYDEYHWSIAWGSSSHPLFKNLEGNKEKIKQIIVGLHFYQTHPDFIEAFMDNKNIRFVEQVNGTFHPKSYLFYNAKDDWKLLIGSANFTKSAFEQNTEISVLVDSSMENSDKVLKQFKTEIAKHYDISIRYNTKKLSDYKAIWKNQQRKIKSLSGQYGGNNQSKRSSKLISNIGIMTMTWNSFISKVKDEVNHGMKDRIKVLDIAHNAFQSTTHFKDISLNERKFIAGIPNNLEEEIWAYFGSMKGAGKYKEAIIQNPNIISQALDEIPLNGAISKAHYNAYIRTFRVALPYNTFLATSTRLLAMKRPDIFVCIDSKNKKQLCKAFGITQSSLENPENYWEDVIMRIKDAEWYQNPMPKTNKERKVEHYKAAFLDALYYVH